MSSQEKNLSVLVLGAGKVGSTIADMLAEFYGLPTTLADVSACEAIQAIDPLVSRVVLDVRDGAQLEKELSQHGYVINALPFFLAKTVAMAAAKNQVHYLDLTEDVNATRAIRSIGKEAHTALMPQCGLAPGVVGILGGALASDFDELYDLRMRVGALTRQATSGIRYNFTWSIDGVINEYCNPCDAIVNGRRCEVQPLEGYETLNLDGDEFEAFNTAGGLGTLCETLEGRVRNLDYKTMRYPGHRSAMSLLLNDLRLIERRDLLRTVLEGAVAHSRDDMVVIFASASGLRSGRLEQETRMSRIYGAQLRGKSRTAIELTTSAGVVGALELLMTGAIPKSGFISQEQVSLDQFINTRVGMYFAELHPHHPVTKRHDSVMFQT